jgi:hypothetical protein
VNITHNLRRRLLLLIAPLLLAVGITSSPALAAISSPQYVDSGWQYYDGGCQARTQAIYYPATNTISMKTDVSDPYLFVACRVDAKAIYDTNLRPVEDGATNPGMACAVLDPTCASTTYGPWRTYGPASQNLEFLRAFGFDLTTLINNIRIQQVKSGTGARASAAHSKSSTSARLKGAKRATKAQIEAKAKKFAAKH